MTHLEKERYLRARQIFLENCHQLTERIRAQQAINTQISSRLEQLIEKRQTVLEKMKKQLP